MPGLPFFMCAQQGLSLGGEQFFAIGCKCPPPARQGERLAEGKGACREVGTAGSEGSPEAKRWPDEQKTAYEAVAWDKEAEVDVEVPSRGV